MDLDDHVSGLGNEYPPPDRYYGSEPYPLAMTQLKNINVMFFGSIIKKLIKFCYDVVILRGDFWLF